MLSSRKVGFASHPAAHLLLEGGANTPRVHTIHVVVIFSPWHIHPYLTYFVVRPLPGSSSGYIAVQSPYFMLVWMMVRFQSALWIT